LCPLDIRWNEVMKFILKSLTPSPLPEGEGMGMESLSGGEGKWKLN